MNCVVGTYQLLDIRICYEKTHTLRLVNEGSSGSCVVDNFSRADFPCCLEKFAYLVWEFWDILY